jgi:hypothetical protein
MEHSSFINFGSFEIKQCNYIRYGFLQSFPKLLWEIWFFLFISSGLRVNNNEASNFPACYPLLPIVFSGLVRARPTGKTIFLIKRMKSVKKYFETFSRFQKPFAVVFKQITCSAVIAVEPYCTIKAVSRTKTLVSAGCTLKVPLQKLYVRRCRNFGFRVECPK